MRKLPIPLLILAALLAAPLPGQQPGPDLYWRSIGPYRGGRTVAASGVPSQHIVFYIGANNGGVWKTTDAGRTWQPIFDSQPTGSPLSLSYYGLKDACKRDST